MPFLKKQNKSKHLNGRKLKNSKRQRNLVFQNCGTIDVTYFDAMTPDDFIGYLSGGIVQVFSDGDLIIYSEDEKSILENINLSIFSFNISFWGIFSIFNSRIDDILDSE